MRWPVPSSLNPAAIAVLMIGERLSPGSAVAWSGGGAAVLLLVLAIIFFGHYTLCSEGAAQSG